MKELALVPAIEKKTEEKKKVNLIIFLHIVIYNMLSNHQHLNYSIIQYLILLNFFICKVINQNTMGVVIVDINQVQVEVKAVVRIAKNKKTV